MNKDSAEKAEKKAVSRQNTALLLFFLKGSKRLFAASIIASLVSALAEMISPQIFRAAIDNAIGGNAPNLPAFAIKAAEMLGGFEYLGEHLWIMAAAVIAVSLVRVLSAYCQRVFNSRGAETLVRTMRDRLFMHIEQLPYEWHMKNHTGDIIQRCTSDVEMVRQFVSEQLVSVVRIVILIVLSLSFMLMMDPLLTLIAMVPIPFILIYALVFRKDMERGFRECDEMEGRVSARIQENLTGMRVVRAFAREKKEKESFEEFNNSYNNLWLALTKTMSRFFSVQMILSSLQTLIVIIFGCVFCVNGRISAGEYIAFISYNGMLGFPIRRLGRMISEMSKAGVSLERMGHIMNEPAEEDAEDAAEPPMDRDIRFEHVSFSYEGGREILKDINLEIKAGSTLGILGATGSGKSTMMLLLDKMYRLPKGCGRITVGGVDINSIRTKYLRKNIAMVLQEPFLFSRTIEENIGISAEGASPEAVRRAAASACLDESIEKFDEGYKTLVGERGVTLSGGQKQRAAIARALLSAAPVMIFDDSLSAVDTKTDAMVRKAIEEKFGTATVILISHRITTLSKADKVIVLDGGRIAEEGSPEELKALGGIYSRICQIQSGQDGEAYDEDRK